MQSMQLAKHAQSAVGANHQSGVRKAPWVLITDQGCAKRRGCLAPIRGAQSAVGA